MSRSGRLEPSARLRRVWASVDSWLLASAPPERLATLRIVIGGFVTVWLLASIGEVARLAERDPAEFDPVGITTLLASPLPAGLLWLGWAVVVALGVAFTAGVSFGMSGPLFAIGVLLWAGYHSSWGRLLHFEHLFTLHVLVLGFAPAADVLRLRLARRRSSVTTRPAASMRYGWPVRLMALATVATYVLSGIAKLRYTGLDWFGPDVLADHIAYSATRADLVGVRTPPLAAFVLERTWLLPAMAVGALAVELGAPVALVESRWRTLWIASALVFHAATGLTMWVFFGYRGLGVGLLPLIAAEQLPHALPRSRGVSR